MPEIEFFQLTDTGCVRDTNEDAVGAWPHEDGLLFAVADGLGGHNAGEFASSLALEVLAREMDRAPGSWPVQKRLRRAVQEANLEIYNKGVTVPELRRMGTTLTASALVGHTLVTAHVGDCRLYLWRDRALTQLTKDHTWVWEQVQYGILSPEEARTHPRRHILSRSLGQNLIVSVDVLSIDIQPGDVMMQCSDGVHALLPEAEVTAALSSSPEDACRMLVERARGAGGDDNLSVQIAAVVSSPQPTPRPWWRFLR
jgi:serine/threonine protein phosphatase PrpC